MKGVKGKFLKKLKSIKPVGVLKQARVLHINAFNGFLDPSSSSSSSSPLNTNSVILQDSSNYRNQEDHRSVQVKNLDVDIAELIKDLEDEEMEFGEGENKENIGPLLKKLKDPFLVPDDKEKFKNPTLSESENDLSCAPSSFHRVDSTSLKDNSEIVGVDVSSFRRPDLSAGSLFDPNLLAAFDKARMEHIILLEALREARIEEKKVEEVEEEGPPLKARRLDEDPLLEFEEKCPPGGSELVILYTTSLRGIRKTFEDCQSIRFLLDSFKILFHERDVSMHLEYREEMWRILDSRVVPPRLFIKGRYIGGADTVVTLHEEGKLLQLLEGLPRDQSTSPCDGCGGMHFILCYNCNGSRKISPDGSDDGLSVQCPQCNENGLLVCPMCC